METWFKEDQLSVINFVLRAAGIDSEPWLKKLKRSVQNAIDSGISPDQAVQSEFSIYADFATRVSNASPEGDIEALKQEIISTVRERGSKTNVSSSRSGLRSGDNPGQRLANAMGILKDEAEGLKLAANRAKEGPVQRAATALERAMDDFRRTVTAISENGDITPEECQHRNREAREVFEEAMSFRDDYREKKAAADREAAAAKAEQERQDLLSVLAGNLDMQEARAEDKVRKAHHLLEEGAFTDEDAVSEEIEDLVDSMKKVKVAAEELKSKVLPRDMLRDKPQVAMDRVEEEVNRTVRKLKRRLQFSRSASSVSLAAAPTAAGAVFNQGLTAEEFAKIMCRASQESKFLESIVPFEGDYRKFFKFKKEYQLHLGARNDISDEEKCSYLQSKLLKGTARKEVENYEDLQQVWDNLDRKYNKPALYSREVLKNLKEQKPIASSDVTALNRFYGLVLSTHRELLQHKQEREMETFTFLSDMVSKLPLLERNEWVKSRRRETPDEFLEFAKRRQVEVADLDIEVSGTGSGRGGGTGTSGGGSGGGGTRGSGGGPGTSQQSTSPRANQMKKAASNVATAGNGSQSNSPRNKAPWACGLQCQDRRFHYLEFCFNFHNMQAVDRAKIVESSKFCLLCMRGVHTLANCRLKNDPNRLCSICKKDHHWLLHGTTINGVTLHTSFSAATVGGPGKSTNGSSGSGVVLLKVQYVPVEKAPSCLLLWDDGSQVSLITFSFADRVGLKGKPKKMQLTVAGGHTSLVSTKEYQLPLVDRKGVVRMLVVYGIETITSNIKQVSGNDFRIAKRMFPGTNKMFFDNPVGRVDVLVGLAHNGLHPKEIQTAGNLRLYKSEFGSGFLFGGKIGSEDHQIGSAILTAAVMKIRQGHFVPCDFISAEAIGTETPRRCNACKNCSECQYRTENLTWQENHELAIIEDGLKLDEKRSKWTAKYPFMISPNILVDNKRQAEACMKKLEKQLLKKGELVAFNNQFNESVERGVFKKITPEEALEYAGPVNYISFVVAYKNGPHATTPLRICLNSAMKQNQSKKSLNDLLIKGPSALADLFAVCLGHREHIFALAKDLSKFYQCVDADELAQHLRRVVWRGGELEREPDIYITTTVNFGDRPAGAIAITAVRETARRFEEISPEAAWFIQNRTYVDDALAGSDEEEKLEVISQGMEAIVARGGFKFKETVKSGDPVDDQEHLRKVLGVRWDTERDRLLIEVRVNYSGKRKGANIEPDTDLGNVEGTMPEVITKRILWRVSMGQYDPLGLVSVFLIRLKLLMRDVSQEDGQVAGWDDPVPPGIREDFIGVLKEMKSLREVSFPRSIKPATWRKDAKPTLMVFGDGSTQAYCSLAYARWELEDGSVVCRLIAGKTRVAPKKKISVPRLELMGAVLAVRLAKKIKDSLKIEFLKTRFFTDSTAVLGMLQNDSAAFLEFVGTRVSEVKTKSNVDSEWSWISTEKNLADMGTRSNVTVGDIREESEYQCGMAWMLLPEEDWPAKMKITPPPQEEMKKGAVAATCNVATVKEPFIRYSTTLARTQRVCGYVFLFLCRLRKKTEEGLQVAIKDGREIRSGPPPMFLQMAEDYLVEEAQGDLDIKQLDTLMPVQEKFVDLLGCKRTHWMVGGRMKTKLKIGYDKPGLPILDYNCPLAKLFLEEAHRVDHGGQDNMVLRSRKRVWIVKARRIAKVVKENCFRCKLLYRRTMNQKMGPMPAHRVGPSPIFYSTAVDLFGPLTIRDAVKKRTRAKAWGVIFTCTATSAVCLELTESYSMDSFLQALVRFTCAHGMPARFQSDQGDQLVAASKQLATWDYSKVLDWCGVNKTEWIVVPTHAQHFNGQAERLVGLAKLCLEQVLGERVATFGELATALKEAEYMMNSRPLAIKPGSDPDMLGPITPLHLMGGRASVYLPEIKLETQASLTRRMQFLEETRKEFWEKWMSLMFGKMVPATKWRKEYPDLKVGDVVLMKEESVVSCNYRLGRVVEVFVGEDGHVRRAVVTYKNPGEAVFRRSERPIHKLILVVPSE